MVRRGDVICRLVFLNYELLPMTERQQFTESSPVFVAPVVCIPEQLVPAEVGDGRQQRPAVGSTGVSGSRGPWPIAGNAERVSFVMYRQPATGRPAQVGPAGSLLVELSSARAVWRPVGGKPS
jgi:hypothetical protein